MSRLGKLEITIPKGVTVTRQGTELLAKGPKGEVREHIPVLVQVKIEADNIVVSVKNPESGEQRALWGLARQLVANAVHGVSEGFVQKLELSGIGLKAQIEGKDLVMSLGFSHPVRFTIPANIVITVEKNTQITISGASKQQVGQVAAEIRAFKKPEPYKGKGIKYAGEVVRRKAGKVVKAAGAK